MGTKRLSVTVDTALVEEAVQVSGAASQREAIDLALRELVRRHRLEQMARRGGAVPLTMSVDDLVRDRTRARS
jgi:Arc/MetJ family transcription regulator